MPPSARRFRVRRARAPAASRRGGAPQDRAWRPHRRRRDRGTAAGSARGRSRDSSSSSRRRSRGTRSGPRGRVRSRAHDRFREPFRSAPGTRRSLRGRRGRARAEHTDAGCRRRESALPGASSRSRRPGREGRTCLAARRKSPAVPPWATRRSGSRCAQPGPVARPAQSVGGCLQMVAAHARPHHLGHRARAEWLELGRERVPVSAALDGLRSGISTPSRSATRVGSRSSPRAELLRRGGASSARTIPSSKAAERPAVAQVAELSAAMLESTSGFVEKAAMSGPLTYPFGGRVQTASGRCRSRWHSLDRPEIRESV